MIENQSTSRGRSPLLEKLMEGELSPLGSNLTSSLTDKGIRTVLNGFTDHCVREYGEDPESVKSRLCDPYLPLGEVFLGALGLIPVATGGAVAG